MTDFEKQMAFIMELDKIKKITRQTYLSDGSRKENDAEHSWHLALMAVLLKEYANEEVDLAKVIPMVLLHDLVEIDAGDTYAYDQAGLATQRARETKAADRIFGMLPEEKAGRNILYIRVRYTKEMSILQKVPGKYGNICSS